MSVSVYKNVSGKAIQIPAPSGTTILLEAGKAVKGNYYAELAAAGFLQLSSTPESEEVVYTYPEQYVVYEEAAIPATGTATGIKGEMRLDTSDTVPVVYVCPSTNTWEKYKRADWQDWGVEKAKGRIICIAAAGPATGTVTCIAPAAKASGLITCTTVANLVDTETVTIQVGANTAKVFEFDKAGNGVAVPGNIQVIVSTDTSAAEVALRLRNAITNNLPTGLASATVTQTSKIALVPTAYGTASNFTLSDSVTNGAFTTSTVAAATGILDTETVVINDGTDTYTFEFDVIGGGVTEGREAVDISACTTAVEVGNVLETAIGTSGARLTVTQPNPKTGVLTLVTTDYGDGLNNTITDTVVAAGFTHTGFTGGQVGIVDGETVTVSDGLTSKIYEYDEDAGGVDGTNVAIVFAANATHAAIATATAAAIDGGSVQLDAAVNGTEDSWVDLVNKRTGTYGNVTITHTVAEAGYEVYGTQDGVGTTAQALDIPTADDDDTYAAFVGQLIKYQDVIYECVALTGDVLWKRYDRFVNDTTWRRFNQ